VLIRSGSSAYGGILAADGNQLLGLRFSLGTILQNIAFSAGAMYNLSFYAASDTGGAASVVAYVGPIAVLTLVAPPVMVMTFYSVSFIADASSQSISFESKCGASGSCVAFIDMIMITQGLLLLMVCGSCLIDVVHPIISVIVGAITTSDHLAVEGTKSDIFTNCG